MESDSKKQEYSGVVRRGNELLFVHDDVPGRYREAKINGGSYIPLESVTESVLAEEARLAMDLESIDLLGDRVVLLSERLRGLVTAIEAEENGQQVTRVVLVEYSHKFAVFGNRSLEGLAIRANKEKAGDADVAVVWEGGYPEYSKVQPQLLAAVGRLPLEPRIITHTLPVDISADREVKEKDEDVNVFTLRMPPYPGRNEFRDQFFRAPDLVWHGDEFIVLLSSEDSPTTGRPEFMHKLLQRFGADGQPHGEPLDLTKVPVIVDNKLTEANWEGLNWYEEGKSLVLVFDKYPKEADAAAVVIDLPKGW